MKINKDFGLKILHSGKYLMHARNAAGIFNAKFKAIGVSYKGGERNFNLVMAHEYAHFLDHLLGKLTQNHYMSDKEGSITNRIANLQRNLMNRPTTSRYINRTCECFARAMEQYHAIQIYGHNAKECNEIYYKSDNYVNIKDFEASVEPLIERLLKYLDKKFYNNIKKITKKVEI